MTTPYNALQFKKSTCFLTADLSLSGSRATRFHPGIYCLRRNRTGDLYIGLQLRLDIGV